jgi:DNA-cytosine methyltransferase
VYERTHASFFSGVGGLDLGLERAGWRTVSFSEIDPYASAVLAQRWPGVPNLGEIMELVRPRERASGRLEARRVVGAVADWEWHRAELWSGGFPCQDLSVAGKRRGLAGERSGLAFAFLGLVERHRPRWVLLENVPGLLSSHRGRDLASLLGRLSELGYGVAYRVLDARYFGVAQRRRRVFILASRDPGGRAGALRAAEVLSLAARGGGHPATDGEAWPRAAGGADDSTHGVVADGAATARTVQSAFGHHGWTLGAQDADGGYLQLGPSPDAGRDGAPHGLAGRAHDRGGVAATLNSGGNNGGFRTEPGEHLVATLRVGGRDDGAGSSYDNTPWGLYGDGSVTDDALLPNGLDSHRYRCCGNGVVSNVAEAIGRALLAVIEQDAAA